MNRKSLLLIFIGSICFWIPALAEKLGDAGIQLTGVNIEEDWPADSLLDLGTMNCSGGELTWIDPVTPICAASGQLHFRNLTGYACDDSDDPRFSGIGMFEANGNLDANYTGPVWGTWMIVPSLDCDLLDLIDPPVYWKGTWQGQRSLFCGGGPCMFIGDLKLVGKGHGGDIHGIHFKGNELITTFTPMPVPWELIPGFPVDGPEAVITAIIKE